LAPAAVEIDLGTVDLAATPPSSKSPLETLHLKRGDLARFRGLLLRENLGGNVPVFIDLLETRAGSEVIVNSGGTREMKEQSNGWQFMADVEIPKRSPTSLRLVVKSGAVPIAQGRVEISD
jgi:hypothetical protein